MKVQEAMEMYRIYPVQRTVTVRGLGPRWLVLVDSDDVLERPFPCVVGKFVTEGAALGYIKKVGRRLWANGVGTDDLVTTDEVVSVASALFAEIALRKRDAMIASWGAS